MKYVDKSCAEFTELTAGKVSVPGGGSVSALAGALGAALGTMVGNYTVGKKKYSEVEAEIEACMEETEKIREKLLQLVQADIDAFQPLSQLYGMNADTDEAKAEKDRLMEAALNNSCAVPLEIMRQCARAIELAGVYARKGSTMMTSDAGASAILCKGAMEAASLNVYINTSSMKDRERADALNRECEEMLAEYREMADGIFAEVSAVCKG